MKLFKTTLVIWSQSNPSWKEIDEIAEAAVSGDAYCSRRIEDVVEDPKGDPDWDGTEFFDGMAEEKDCEDE